MSKLVDKERLARLAAALDQRAKAAVKAEEERAMAVEAELQADIDAINHAETGILAQAKAHVATEIEKVNGDNAAVVGRVEALEEADEAMQAEIDAAAGKAAANEAAINKLNGAADAEGSIAKAIADAVAPLNAKDAEHTAAIEAAQEAAEKGIADAAAVAGRAEALEKAAEEMEAAIEAAQEAVDKLNATEGEGSVAKAIADAVAPVQDKVDAVEADVAKVREDFAAADAGILTQAKSYTDQQITALVDSAPEAMNTLKELATAIQEHGTEYEAYVATVSANLDKKVDKVEGSRLISETEAAAYAAKAEVADVEAAEAAANAYTDGKVATINAKDEAQDQSIAAAKAAADKAQEEVDAAELRIDALEARDEEMQAEIDANEAAIAKLNGAADAEGSVAKAIADAVAPINAKDVAQDARLDALEELVSGEEDGIVSVKEDVAELQNQAQANAKAASAAQAAADKAQGEVDVVEGRVDALEEADEAMQAEIDANEAKAAANEAAIAKLNGGADVEGSVAKSIADALADYSDTEELKVMLGNVVNSLALSMEDNKMKLKLGGVEGITIHETSLDMATDDDIDAIIAGLDA